METKCVNKKKKITKEINFLSKLLGSDRDDST